MIIHLMPFVLISFLLIGSMFDIFNNEMIPVPLGIIGIIIKSIELIICEPQNALMHVVCAIAVCLLFLVGAYMGAYGGADSIFAAMTGLYLGMDGVIAILISIIISLPYSIYLKRKEVNGEISSAEFPFIPFLFVGTLIMVFKSLLF